MTARRPFARLLFVVAALLLAAAPARALTWQALLDTDGAASGCAVEVTDQAEPDGQVAGVDYILTVELDPDSNTVSSTGLSACAAAGRMQPQAAALAAAAGLTDGGRRFAEAGILLGALGDPSAVTVVYAADDGAGGRDAAYTSASGGAVSGFAYDLGPDAAIPLLGPLALALLAVALGGLALRRRPGRAAPLVLAAVVLASGAAWAVYAAIGIDGQPGDWAGIAPRDDDGSGGPTTEAARLWQSYLAHDGEYFYLRADFSPPDATRSTTTVGGGGRGPAHAASAMARPGDGTGHAEGCTPVTDRVYESGEVVACEEATLIEAGPNVIVRSGADVTYTAPRIVLKAGFTVQSGATFRADGPNRAPVLGALSDQTVTLGSLPSVLVDADGTDADGDSLSYALSGAAFLTIDAVTGEISFNGTPSAGSYTVTVSVSDGVASDSVSFSLRVNTAPVLSAIADQTVTPSSLPSVLVNADATDADGDSLSYALSGAAFLTIDTATGEVSFDSTPSAGSYTVTVSVSDGVASDTVSFSLAVIAGDYLNDTGITWGGSYPTGNNATCTGETIAAQDCSHGRDVTHNDESDGHAGFSFTKLDSNGADLPATATEWSCVRDNVTGLIWEVKADDGGLQDKDWGYTWYDTDSPDGNPGSVGDTSTCGDTLGGQTCNTENYVAAVKAAGLCGAGDWRMPTVKELEGIVDFGRHSPAIDTDYFPNTQSGDFWSGLPYADGVDAWGGSFQYGTAFPYTRSWDLYVRLVRGEQ